MKKPVRFTAAILAAMMMTASAAYAQGEGGPPADAKPDPAAEAAAKTDNAAGFSKRKEEILLHIKNKKAELDKKEACVSAAADINAIMMCGMGHHGMGGPKKNPFMIGGNMKPNDAPEGAPPPPPPQQEPPQEPPKEPPKE